MARIGYFKAKIEDFDKFYDFFSDSTKDLFANEYGSNTIAYFLAHSDSKTNIKKSFRQGLVLTARDDNNIVGYIVIREKPEDKLDCG
ncbi:MAG: hypothetical protein HW405_643 [Candidatus Berkelbacteria bacterium]|nr:hypothetical protein [Candidatus Berkelbacteria bacterium]